MTTYRGYLPSGGLNLAPAPSRPVNQPDRHERRRLCSIPATLGGKPAAVTGAENRMARIICLDGSLSQEYNWVTVARLAAMDVPAHGVIRFGWMKD